MSDSVFGSLLNRLGTFYRPALNSTPNSFGERQEIPGSILLEDIPINLQPNKEKFEITMGGVSYWVEVVAYLEPQDLKVTDILEVDGIKYLIIGIEDDGGITHHQKIFLVKQ